MSGNWVVCTLDNDYEICKSFPYQIRKIENEKIIKESEDKNGYVICYMNAKKYLKHRIVATQFLPNPENLPFVDHINHDTTDYHIKNLRWVSASDNSKNRSGNGGVKYIIIKYEDAPDDLIKVTKYNNHHFKDYYYSPEKDKFYFDSKVNFREMPVCYDRESAIVCMRSINNKKVKIYFTKFKREYLD